MGGCLIAFLAIVVLGGNIILFDGSLSPGGDLDGNGVGVIFALLAVLADIYIVYLVGKIAFESIKTKDTLKKAKKIREVVKKSDDIIIKYSPRNIVNLKKTTFKEGNKKYQNQEVSQEFNLYKKKIETKILAYNDISKQIENILSCDGYKEVYTKYNYLNENIELLKELKGKSDEIYKEIIRYKIRLLNEDVSVVDDVKKIFLLLRQSKNIITKNGDTFNYGKVPEELSIFEYQKTPAIVFFIDNYYCFFSKFILVFDTNGSFLSALDPTSMKINIDKHIQLVNVRNSQVSWGEFTNTDSKLIERGTSHTTWLYTRNDGQPDRRYSNNPSSVYRQDVYEYANIIITIDDKSISIDISSSEAIEAFEKLGKIYIKKYNNLHNPIPRYLKLIKSISVENENIDNLINAYKNISKDENYFCKIIEKS